MALLGLTTICPQNVIFLLRRPFYDQPGGVVARFVSAAV